MYRTLAMISLAAFGAAGLLGAGAQAGTYAGTSATAENNSAGAMVERTQSFDIAQTDEPAMDLKGIRKQDGAEYEPGTKPENVERKGTAPQTETDEPATDMRRIEQLEGSEAGKGSGDVGRKLKGPLNGTDEPAMEIEPPKKSEGGESR